MRLIAIFPWLSIELHLNIIYHDEQLFWKFSDELFIHSVGLAHEEQFWELVPCIPPLPPQKEKKKKKTKRASAFSIFLFEVCLLLDGGRLWL